MLKTEVIAKINEVLHAQLDDIGFESADIAEAEDHDGEPVLQIVIKYGKVGATIDPTPTFSLARYLKEAIRPLGEQRFPHLRHEFPDDLILKVA